MLGRTKQHWGRPGPIYTYLYFFFRTTIQIPSHVFRSIAAGGEFFNATIPTLLESSWKWLWRYWRTRIARIRESRSWWPGRVPLQYPSITMGLSKMESPFSVRAPSRSAFQAAESSSCPIEASWNSSEAGNHAR
jgi:hypothetical protein